MDQNQKDRKHKKKKSREDFQDDGHVIANMNIEGMPRSFVRRRAFDEFGEKQEKKDVVKLDKREHLAVMIGIITSYVLYGLVFFGALALLIWFAITHWFK